MPGPDLGRMVGPLPVGGWAVVIVGGIGAAYVINRRSSGVPSDLAAEPADTSLDPTRYNPSGTSGGAVGLAPQLDTGTAAGFVSNDEWANAAVRALVNNNVATGYRAGQLVQKVLEGRGLTAEEQAIMDRAYRLVGPPPMGVPIATGNSPTSPVRSTASAREFGVDTFGRRYTRSGYPSWTAGESMEQIAARARARGLTASGGRPLSSGWVADRNKSLYKRYGTTGRIPAKTAVYL